MNESPIFTKTYDLLLWLIPLATKFPRSHRFGLGERVTRRAFDFQESILAAGLKRGPERELLLRQADVQLAQLRQYLRLGKDLELLSIGQYEFAAARLVEVGRLLGGWVKTSGGTGQADSKARGAGGRVEQQS